MSLLRILSAVRSLLRIIPPPPLLVLFRPAEHVFPKHAGNPSLWGSNRPGGIRAVVVYNKNGGEKG